MVNSIPTYQWFKNMKNTVDTWTHMLLNFRHNIDMVYLVETNSH